MGTDLMPFRDSSELKSGWRAVRSCCAGVVATAVVIGGPAVAVKLFANNYNFSEKSAQESSAKNCKVSKPFAQIALAGGDAEVQIIERVDTVNAETKLGWLCVRLVSTGATEGQPRKMSLSAASEGNQIFSSEGEYSYYSDWLVVEPNTPIEVDAVVKTLSDSSSQAATADVHFDLIYPADQSATGVTYSHPLISGIEPDSKY